jgi:hypothetical protein
MFLNFMHQFLPFSLSLSRSLIDSMVAKILLLNVKYLLYTRIYLRSFISFPLSLLSSPLLTLACVCVCVVYTVHIKKSTKKVLTETPKSEREPQP